jgi:probable phosphoglycerate mutase
MHAPLLPLRLHLIRHGETTWSLSGQHTSRTDLALTPHGADQARQLGARLGEIKFSRVFTSPRRRARETCELAGLAAGAEVDDDLREWDYGEYEGRTSAEIRAARADWNLLVDGAPGGETPAVVLARAQNFIRRVQGLEGNVAVFSHGHFLRVLAVTWAQLPLVHAQRFALNTGSIGVLAHEHERRESPVIALWNDTGAFAAPR